MNMLDAKINYLGFIFLIENIGGCESTQCTMIILCIIATERLKKASLMNELLV